MFDNEKIHENLDAGNGLYGDLFTEKRTYTHIHRESERIEKLEQGLDEGVGLRLITPWKVYFASTNNTDEKNLLDMAGTLSKFSRENSKVNKNLLYRKMHRIHLQSLKILRE